LFSQVSNFYKRKKIKEKNKGSWEHRAGGANLGISGKSDKSVFSWYGKPTFTEQLLGRPYGVPENRL